MDYMKLTKRLPVKLTNDELLALMDEFTHVADEVMVLDIQQKRYASKKKEREERKAELTELMKSKEEIREVECKWTYYWELGKKILFRLDTYETLEEELIEERERQQHLFETDEEVPAEMPLACTLDSCAFNKKDEPNGCSELENIYECGMLQEHMGVTQ